MKYLAVVSLLICSVTFAQEDLLTSDDVADAWSDAVDALHVATNSKLECADAKAQAQESYTWAVMLGATTFQLQDGDDCFDAAVITAATADTFYDGGEGDMDIAASEWNAGNILCGAGYDVLASLNFSAAIAYYGSAATYFLGDFPTPGAVDVYSLAQDGFADAKDAWDLVIEELEQGGTP